MKSGLELLQEVLEKLDELNRRCAVIEQTMNIVLNNVNTQAAPSTKPEIMINNKPAVIKSTVPEPTAPAKIAQTNNDPIQAMPDNTARVIGKIKKEGKSVSGVQVKIFNSNNKVVKQTKTNRAGDWMCFLPVGQYAANYFLKDVIHANSVFTVGRGEKVVRVATPQT